MSVDSSSSQKKHRVIGWKPEGADTTVAPRAGLPRWARNTLVVVGVFLIWRLGIAPFVFRSDRPEAATDFGGTTPVASLTQSFENRSKAEFARSEANRALEVIAKTKPDHPAIINHLVTIDRLRAAADSALGNRDYVTAVQRYEALTTEAKNLATALEDRRKAREGYDRFIVDVERLERFSYLRPEVFQAAITAAGASQSFIDNGSFKLGREKIEQAATMLRELDKAIADELEHYLSIGRAALTNGDGRAAEIAFSRALELEPKHKLAAMGLKRAEHIEAVFSHLNTAAKLEAAGKLEEAQDHFEKAFALDNQSATAQAGISRMKAAIKERDFQQALARAKAAGEANQWDEAIAAYEAALKVVPGDKEVERKLAEARVRQREARIQAMLETAYNYEREYDWEAAKRTYLDLIAYQPGQPEAEEGLLRTGKVIRAILVFEKKLEEARSHAQRANFQLAIHAFNEAMASKPSYLELTPEQNQLKSLLELQSRPVPVTFISDRRTYVTISGVRMLNKFEQTTVSLLPGNYEVIGRRRGYEEVRETLRVRADDPIPPVTIIANKRI